jgi:glutamate formiminotransferase
MRMYTLNEISNLLTNASPTRVYTMQRIWNWCQNEALRYEVIPSGVRGVSFKPVWIREDELKSFLQKKGFNTETLFPTR